jgi:hypothetical protein
MSAEFCCDLIHLRNSLPFPSTLNSAPTSNHRGNSMDQAQSQTNPASSARTCLPAPTRSLPMLSISGKSMRTCCLPKCSLSMRRYALIPTWQKTVAREEGDGLISDYLGIEWECKMKGALKFGRPHWLILCVEFDLPLLSLLGMKVDLDEALGTVHPKSISSFDSLCLPQLSHKIANILYDVPRVFPQVVCCKSLSDLYTLRAP